jgi:hypothetical protein
MTSLNQTNSLTREIVTVRTAKGQFPAIPVGPLEIGGLGNFVVFGAPDPKGVVCAAQIMTAIPFGSRGGDGRKNLLPYWDMA